MPGLYAAAGLNGLGLVLGLIAALAEGALPDSATLPAVQLLAQPAAGLSREVPEIPASTQTVRVGRVEAVEAIALLEAGSIDVPLLRGDPATALATPGSIVLTRRLALKYFGSIDCLGRELEIGGATARVTAIAEDSLPATVGGFLRR